MNNCIYHYAQYRLGKHVTRIIVFVFFFFRISTHTWLYGTTRMSPKCVAKQYSREHAQMCHVINFFVCFKRKFNHILIILLIVLTVVCCSIISKYNNILVYTLLNLSIYSKIAFGDSRVVYER